MNKTHLIAALVAGILLGFLAGDSLSIGRSRIAAAEARVEQVKLTALQEKIEEQNQYRAALVAEAKATEARIKAESADLEKRLDVADAMRARPASPQSDADPFKPFPE